MPTRGWAIQTIRARASAGKVTVVGHPVDRLSERDVPFDHVLHALRHLKTATEQMPSRRWLTTGATGDGGTLAMAVIVAESVIVCTAWRNSR